LWLSGNPEAAMAHVRQAIDLCPSFPNAHYMLGFLECHAGDPALALESLGRSETISPFDPFLPSIQITRAVAHLRLGNVDGAADWAAQAAAHRLAYGHMLAHAALILQLAGRVEEAKATSARLFQRERGYDPNGLFETFYTMPDEVERMFRKALPVLQA
jgi:tetratricopeptide (TPR) repeat protein